MRRSMRCALLLALTLGCGVQLGDPPPTESPTPTGGKGDGPGSGSGSNTGGTGGAPAPITATKYCDGLASDDCTEAFKCRSSFPANAGYSFVDVYGENLGDCQMRLVSDFQPDKIESEIALGRVGFDGEAAAECLQALSYGDCADYFQNGPHWDSPCYQMFTSKVASGGACALDMSCTSGSCDQTTLTCK